MFVRCGKHCFHYQHLVTINALSTIAVLYDNPEAQKQFMITMEIGIDPQTLLTAIVITNFDFALLGCDKGPQLLIVH